MATIIEQGQSGGAGAEKHSRTITVNNKPFTTSEKEMTGQEIKTLAGLPADYELFAVHGANSVPVANSETVHLHDNAEFRAIPTGTFG